jgi:hypothetical protein
MHDAHDWAYCMSDDEPPSHPLRALIGLIAIVAMIICVVFVMYRLHQASALQDCLASGRTNCMPITRNPQ